MARKRAGQRLGRKRQSINDAPPDDDGNSSTPPQDPNSTSDMAPDGVTLDKDTPNDKEQNEVASLADNNQEDAWPVDCVLFNCFDALLDAEDLTEDTTDLWESAEEYGIRRAEHRLEEATLLLGLHRIKLTTNEEIYTLLYNKLLGPLKAAVTIRDADPLAWKVHFLINANIGLRNSEKRSTFIFRNHVFPSKVLIVDLFMNAYFLVRDSILHLESTLSFD